MQSSIPWSSSVYVFVIENHGTTIIHSLKCAVPCPFVLSLLSHIVTHCHLLSLVVTRCIARCHFVTCCTTRCHSSFVDTCSTRCHSLSLVVPLVVTCCTTRCHSLCHWLSLVVIYCHSSLDVPLVCLFMNDMTKKWWQKLKYHENEKSF